MLTDEWTDYGQMTMRKNEPMKLTTGNLSSTKIQKSCKYNLCFKYNISPILNTLSTMTLTLQNNNLFFCQTFNYLKNINFINVLSGRKYISYRSILSQCQLLLCFIGFLQTIPSCYAKYHPFYKNCICESHHHYNCTITEKLKIKTQISFQICFKRVLNPIKIYRNE